MASRPQKGHKNASLSQRDIPCRWNATAARTQRKKEAKYTGLAWKIIEARLLVLGGASGSKSLRPIGKVPNRARDHHRLNKTKAERNTKKNAGRKAVIQNEALRETIAPETQGMRREGMGYCRRRMTAHRGGEHEKEKQIAGQPKAGRDFATCPRTI